MRPPPSNGCTGRVTIGPATSFARRRGLMDANSVYVRARERGHVVGREDSAVEITEVRIKLMEDQQERLQAFCSITFDGCFVIRDLKIIKGAKGSFVAMPSRKLTDRCSRCGAKNCLRAQFCSQCGVQLAEERADKGQDGRAKLYADIAHPINSQCRELIQTRVLSAFEQELVLAREPGYVCRYDDFGEESLPDTSDEDWRLAQDAEGERRADLGRRIEPAAGTPPAPHRSPAGRTSHSLRQAAGERRDDEDFGAGIL